MRILSQNKKWFAVLENITGVSCAKRVANVEQKAYDVAAYAKANERPVSLGKYATEERAQQVLIEIFQNKSELYIMPEE